MERAEARAEGDQLAHATAVGPDERDDLAEQPRFIDAVAAGTLLERDGAVGPRLAIERVHAVQLDPSGFEQIADRGDHPLALELAGVAALGGEGEDGASPVSVYGHAVHRAGHAPASRRVRCGSSASRQVSQSCPPAVSAKLAG